MAGQVKKLSVSEGVSLSGVTDLSFGTQVTVSIADNTGPANITGVSLPQATYKGAAILYDLERRDDGQDATEAGWIYLSYDNEAAAWLSPQVEVYFGNAGVTFSITSAGQLQYTSNNYGGANYSGSFRGKIFSLTQA